MANVKTNWRGDEFKEVLLGMDVEGAYGYTADYAPYVNYPTHYSSGPPYKPIRKWVDRKWNDLDSGLKDAAMPEDGSLSKEEHKDRVAWIVRNAINETGTEGVYFMERSVDKVKSDAGAIASQYRGSDDPNAPFKILRDLLDAGFGISQDIVAEEATDTGNLLQSGYVDVQEVRGDKSFEKEGGN